MRSFLAFPISYNQSILDAYLFLKELRIRYGRKPIWTDDAVWYPEACRWARLEHHVYGHGWMKNLIERMNQALKDRTECFDDMFPCIRRECDGEHVSNWMSVFRFFHNLVVRAEEEQDDDDRPEYERFIETLSEGLT